MTYFSNDEAFLLGKGTMGTSVYAGFMEGGIGVAVKKMLMQASLDLAENEEKIFKLIETKKSPFIVSYQDFFKASNFVYLILDLCEETLKEHVESQSLEDLKEHGPRMIEEILRGLEFLHDQGILHRDLKPSNVLVDIEGHMRLADFGISRVLNEDETTVETAGKGTEGWISAEVIKSRNEGTKVRFKKKSDIQTVGMIAFFILTKGGHPFGSAKYERMTNILEGNPVKLDTLENLQAKEFVLSLINHDLYERPYAREALEHPFMSQAEDYEGRPKPIISLLGDNDR